MKGIGVVVAVFVLTLLAGLAFQGERVSSLERQLYETRIEADEARKQAQRALDLGEQAAAAGSDWKERALACEGRR